LNGVIEPEGYGFNLNSSMKFTWGTFTSIWRVNWWCLGTPKIGQSPLALIAKAAFDTKPAIVLQAFGLWLRQRPLPMMS
jgi:hypothetical protein